MELTSIEKGSVHTSTPPLGPVRNIHTERSDLHKEDEHWVEGTRRQEETFSFDPQGRVVESIIYNVDSSVSMKSTFIYSNAGCLAESTALDGDDTLLYRTIYAYGPENTCALMVYGAGDALEERVVFTDDSEGKPLQRINYYPDGSLKNRWVRDVSSEGVVSKKCVDYGPDGSITGSWTETDDPSRRESQKCHYDADGSLKSRSLSYYDSDRYEIERRNYNNKGALERRLTWNYDSSGNVTKTMEYSALDEIEEERLFVYEYDKVGNWTKRTFLILVLRLGPPAYRPGPFIYRTISYWPDE